MPERYLNDRRVLRLSDGAFRAFVTATMFSVSNRTDGVIENDDLVLLPYFLNMYADELVKAGLWDYRLEGGYMIADFAETQTSSEQLAAAEEARRNDRDRKRAQRAAMKSPPKADTVPEDVQRTVLETTQDRTGEARTGEDRTGQDSKPSHLLTSDSPFNREHNEMQRDAMASWDEVVI